MIVFGKNVFNELKNNAKSIKKVYLSKSFHDKEIIDFIKASGIKYETVDSRRLDEMESGNHQGIIAVINEYEYKEIDSILNEDVIVILDHLEDPHNFGAIIRTCEAAGIKGIIIPKDRSVSVNGTVMKTSSGALEYVSIVAVSNLVNTIKKLKDNNYFIYAAEADGVNYKAVDYHNKCVLVIGSEGNGISRLVRDNSDVIVSIPMQGKVNSLNASVAAGILIYGIK